MELLPDDEAAKAILKDAEAVEQAALALVKDAYRQHRDDTEVVTKALALPAEGF